MPTIINNTNRIFSLNSSWYKLNSFYYEPKILFSSSLLSHDSKWCFFVLPRCFTNCLHFTCQMFQVTFVHFNQSNRFHPELERIYNVTNTEIQDVFSVSISTTIDFLINVLQMTHTHCITVRNALGKTLSIRLLLSPWCSGFVAHFAFPLHETCQKHWQILHSTWLAYFKGKYLFRCSVHILSVNSLHPLDIADHSELCANFSEGACICWTMAAAISRSDFDFSVKCSSRPAPFKLKAASSHFVDISLLLLTF